MHLSRQETPQVFGTGWRHHNTGHHLRPRHYRNTDIPKITLTSGHKAYLKTWARTSIVLRDSNPKWHGQSLEQSSLGLVEQPPQQVYCSNGGQIKGEVR